jgi:O-antigen ligase
MLKMIDLHTLINKIKNDYKYYIMLFVLSLVAFSIPYGRYVININFALSLMLFFWLLLFGFRNIIYYYKENKFLQFFTLFILFNLLSLLWTSNIDEGKHYIGYLFVYFYLPVIIFMTSLNQKNINFIISVFIFSMFINEVISYLLYFDLITTKYTLKHYSTSGFINHIPYSVLVSFTAIYILNQIKYIKNKYIKYIYILFFITMTINLLISGGRTGYVSYFAALSFLMISHYKVGLKKFIIYISLPVFIVYFIYSVDKNTNHRINSIISDVETVLNDGNYNTSFGVRLAAYPMAYHIFKKDNNIFIGTGAGSLDQTKNDTIEKYKLTPSMNSLIHTNHFHNYYVDTLVSVGLIGLFIFIISFYFFWTIPIKDDKSLFIKSLLIITMLVSNLPDRMFDTKETMVFFALFIGMVISQHENEKEEKKKIENN